MDYSIKFKFVDPKIDSQFLVKKKRLNTLPKRLTLAELYKGETLVSYGQAQCSYRDNYNKVEGKKKAFQRAIDHYPKEEKTKLWETFREKIIN